MIMLTIKKPRVARLVSAACAIAGLCVVSGCGDPGTRALLDGERMINERRFSEAVDRLKLATHPLPDNPQAWNHRGLAHHGAKQAAEAAEAYRQALKLNENLASARYNLGALLLETGDARGALQELGSFVVLRPTSVEGHIRLGSAQIRANQWEDAARTHTQAFQMSDSNPEVLNALGVIYLHHGEREKAMPFFDRAVELNANYAPAKLNKAICEHRYGNDPRRALDAYHKFALEHPNAPQAEEVTILAATLDRRLNPRPLVGAASETGKLEFAQLTDRATSAAGDAAAAGTETTGDRQEVPEREAPAAAPTMTFKPLTERAEGTGGAAADAAIAAPVEERSAAAIPPVSTAPSEPVPPVVQTASIPRVGTPAPPADRQPGLKPRPEPEPVVERTVETAAKRDKEPEKEEAAPAAQPAAPAPVTVTKVRAPTPPPAEAKEIEKAEPAKAPEPTKVAPATPTIAVDAAAAEEKETPIPDRPAPRIVPEPTETAAVPPAAESARSASPPRSYVPTYHPAREEEERGFLKRLDPRRFFKSREERRTTTPLPGAGSNAAREAAPQEPAGTVAVRSTSPPTPAPEPTQTVRAPAPAPVRAEPPRYAYSNPPTPRPGDRRAAAPIFLEGLKAHQENRLSEAIKAYKDAAKLDGSLYEAHYNMGLASYQANQLAESLAAYETALAVKPDSGSARFNFAQALLKARYTRDSANELEKLIAAEPSQAAARLAAGNLYAKELGDTARARVHYLKVLELEPNHRQAQAIRYWLSVNR